MMKLSWLVAEKGWPNASKLQGMPNLYDALITLLREHWKNHNNAYPQCIELSPEDLQALNAERKLVNESMNFKLTPEWEKFFHGTPLRVADVSCVVDAEGQRIPIVVTVAATPES
ncbi:MAG: hypothetical protein Q4B46_09800 [Comamonadaceae bacterium]|nr:hypothetical protein [Comamonadaceae bacterium]